MPARNTLAAMLGHKAARQHPASIADAIDETTIRENRRHSTRHDRRGPDPDSSWSGRAVAAVLLPAVVLLLAAPPPSGAEEDPGRRVIIVTTAESDGRLAAAREALAFWNGTLSDLKLRPRLVETSVLGAPPLIRPLETYTRQIWLLAGRPVPDGGGPTPPRELVELDADIVVFFSSQVIFSFAWPFEGRTRYFIGIQTESAAPLTRPNVARNVIAHELGHALGLLHNGDTPTLMCGPCRHLVYSSEHPVFFPLTPAERARLKALHQAE